MPVVGPLSLGRRAQRASVIRYAANLSIRRSLFASGHVKSNRPPSTRTFPSTLPHQNNAVFSHLPLSAPNPPLDPAALHPPSQPHDFAPTKAPIKASTKALSCFGLRPSTQNALKAILGRRLKSLAKAELPTVTSFPLTVQEQAALRSSTYTQHHVDHWLHLLSTDDSLLAARMLVTGPAPPLFVYRQYLNRAHVRPEALRLVLRRLSASYKTDYQSSHHEHVFFLFERLLYHCRRVWPRAIESLAVFLTQHLRLSDAANACIRHADMPTLDISRLTVQYNHALQLVAKPSHISPFKNAVHQEAAQAVILNHMADHDPPLVINREGYRAVARVQLAAKKSESEQEWARLKSPSWPPWKEDRTGMDAHIGLEYGISRAHHVLIRMQEAGYPLQDWEKAVMVYAGWDTDGSPTIQTRAFLTHLSDRATINLWVARIRTTRTAQQAWACFLAYQDENLPPNRYIYHAMFEILIQERKRLSLGPENIGHEVDDDIVDSIYPGDTKEVGSPPSSAHQLTYVRAEMPSIQRLFDHMREDGKSPYDGTLAMLLDSAESLAEGLAFLETGGQKHSLAVAALLNGASADEALQALPNCLFTAYVNLLCRFPHTVLQESIKLQWRYGDQIKCNFDLRQPLARALHLLVHHKRPYRPAWNCIFKALARKTAPSLASSWRSIYLKGQESLKFESELYDKLFAFNLARQVDATMWDHDIALDVDAVLNLCIIGEHAASTSHTVFRHFGTQSENPNPVTARLIAHANEVFEKGPEYLREKFWTLVEGTEDAKALEDQNKVEVSGIVLPRLFVVPRPALLHAYIRALGLFRDFAGLEELVKWMVAFQVELAERRSLDRRGDIMMRKALTALRIFLEGRWDGDWGSSRPTRTYEEVPSVAPSEQIDGIASLVDSVEDWGGWPSDDEVEMYIEIGRQGR